MASLLLFVALREARRHKWEQSERAGHDLGSKPVLDWFKNNWSSWYRDHWVEHIYGKKFWNEFGEDEFALVDKYKPDEKLVLEIIQHVVNYGENLGIIMWARNTNQNMDQVLTILKQVDINAKRAEIEENYIETLAAAMDEADRYKWIQSEKAGRDLGEAAISEWFIRYWQVWSSKIVKE